MNPISFTDWAGLLAQGDAAGSLAEQLSWPHLEAILPPLILFAGGCLILLVDTFLRGWRQPSEPGEKGALHFLALLATVIAAAVVCASFQDSESATYFQGALRIDRFTGTVSLFILVGTFLALMASVDHLHPRGIEHGEYHCLVLFAAGAMILFAESNNIIMLFLSLETLSMAVYVLSAFQRDEKRSVEGGLKYFILGGLASSFLLLGLVFLYGATGEIELAAMAEAPEPDGPLLRTGLTLTLVGLAFKVGAFPFHSWVPDAYEGAPAVVTGFMAVTVKISTFAVLLRLLSSFGGTESSDLLVSIVTFLAAATMIFGNLVALVQESVKRMLAYSAIAHTGYLLVGAVASLPSESQAGGAASVLFYLLPYSLMTLGAFTLLNFAERDGRERERFADYRGLARERPALALGLLVILISYAGLPPTAGFWAKLFILRAAVSAGHYTLAVVGILTSIVSVYYYLRLVVNFYMRPPASEGSEDEVTWSEGRLASALVVGTAAVVIVLIGLFPETCYVMSTESAAALSVKK